MKKIASKSFICLIIFFGISGCNQTVDIEAEKANVKLVVDQFAQFWETEDMELLSNIMAHDTDMALFGSDAMENFKGWDDFKMSVEQMFPAFSDTKIKVRDQIIKVNSPGKVAWFSELWDWDLMYDGQPVKIYNQRLTGVLEKRDGKWVLVQFHNSVPVTQ